MKEIEFLNINPRKRHRFLRHCCDIIKRRKDKVAAKEELFVEIEEIKQLMRSRDFKKPDLIKRLEDLKWKLSEAVEKGSKVTRHHILVEHGYHDLMYTIDKLHRTIDTYTKNISSHSKEKLHLEEEIIKEKDKKRIKELEEKFTRLERLDTIDAEKLKKLRERIDKVKNNLQVFGHDS